MLFEIFPIFGLVAFLLLWTHAVSGFVETPIRRWSNRLFDEYVYWSALVILVCIILHPLLLLIATHFNFTAIFGFGEPYVWLGISGWVLLISYDITKPWRSHRNFAQHWRKVLILSNIGFVLIFFHSLNLGDDFHSGPLHWLWIFFGVSAIAGILYTYGFKRSLK